MTTEFQFEYKADEYNAPRQKKKHRRTAKGGIPQKNPFVEMLQQTSVESILPSKRTVIVLDDTNTVHEALRVRTAPTALLHFFHSIPIYCENTH